MQGKWTLIDVDPMRRFRQEGSGLSAIEESRPFARRKSMNWNAGPLSGQLGIGDFSGRAPANNLTICTWRPTFCSESPKQRAL